MAKKGVTSRPLDPSRLIKQYKHSGEVWLESRVFIQSRAHLIVAVNWKDNLSWKTTFFLKMTFVDGRQHLIEDNL